MTHFSRNEKGIQVHMTSPDPIIQLADHVETVLGPGPFPPPTGWTHMGAVICDAVLQGGLTYETTVRPSIVRLQERWPDANTVAGFRARLTSDDLAAVLRNHNRRKLATIPALAASLADAGVETSEHLCLWLDDEVNRAALLGLHGVGPKTVDYLSSLVGRPSVAIDRHLRSFAKDAGVDTVSYADLRTIYEHVADRLGHDRSGLEHAVWRNESGA
jgi:endonuclease III-like uncharacterized protein